MPETIPLQNTAINEHRVQIRNQPHGLLVVNTILHDSGRGRHLSLEIAGVMLKASIAVKALRSAPNLSGEWRATLNLRSGATGQLEGAQFVRRLRPITPTISDQPAFWTCTGEIVGVDLEAETLELRVQGGQRGHGSYTVSANVARSLLERLEGARFAHLTGSLDGLQLVATQVEVVAEEQLETRGGFGRERTQKDSMTTTTESRELK